MIKMKKIYIGIGIIIVLLIALIGYNVNNIDADNVTANDYPTDVIMKNNNYGLNIEVTEFKYIESFDNNNTLYTTFSTNITNNGSNDLKNINIACHLEYDGVEIYGENMNDKFDIQIDNLNINENYIFEIKDYALLIRDENIINKEKKDLELIVYIENISAN
jgi:hypothetical protein